MKSSRRAILGSGVMLSASPLIPHALANPGPGPKVSGPLRNSRDEGYYVYDVAPQGYEAVELIMTGRADVLESMNMSDAAETMSRNTIADLSSRDFNPKVVRPLAPYSTRLIVYRPADPARFSGNVIVESLHPAEGGSAYVWGEMNAFFLGRGDAYVLVQHPVVISGLTAAAPQRYGMLASEHPTQIWGMLRDAGLLAKAGALLGRLKVRRAYLTGFSWTGVAAATFANAHHARARTKTGAPVYDGYLPMANGTYVRPLDVPVIRINSQGDYNGYVGLKNRLPDSDDPAGRHRLYEVAGTAHLHAPANFPKGAAAPRQKAKPVIPGGQPPLDAGKCMAAFPAGSTMNDAPFALVAAAAFVNMSAWVDQGVAPPRADRIETLANGTTKVDAFGNAEGGLRLPQLSVPAARYGVGDGRCALFGYVQPFSASEMRTLYGSLQQYRARFTAAVADLVAKRYVLKEHASILEAEAARHAAF